MAKQKRSFIGIASAAIAMAVAATGGVQASPINNAVIIQAPAAARIEDKKRYKAPIIEEQDRAAVRGGMRWGNPMIRLNQRQKRKRGRQTGNHKRG